MQNRQAQWSTGEHAAYVDVGKGTLADSPLHAVLVAKPLARKLWGTEEPDDAALLELHSRIAESVTQAARFPHEPAFLSIPAHNADADEVRCMLRYKPLGHVAGLCLEFSE